MGSPVKFMNVWFLWAGKYVNVNGVAMRAFGIVFNLIGDFLDLRSHVLGLPNLRLPRARLSWCDRRSNKIVKENQDRGWFKDGPRCPKQVSVKSCLLLPLTKFSKNCVFSASVNFKVFFDKYLAVKSHSHFRRFFVEFINVSKTVLGSKIYTPWAEILAFFWDKVHRNSSFWQLRISKQEFIENLEFFGKPAS